MVGNHKPEAPKVGDGATVILWTDRYAGTIVKVTPTQIHVQRDKATRLGKIEMSDSQQYEYAPDSQGQVYVFRKTKRRGYRCGSFGLALGVRQEYYDYGF